ncbi:DUF7282 domain-containing protein [Halobacterium wangiae]|uniref:DUF7282 domain-containing protein n=1 Tax=Halobacterium wangiae TaxID=2902623 RepID=UPI001E29A026|nr:BGTF surface domain-containing protein [Halobacterium wangiae]
MTRTATAVVVALLVVASGVAVVPTTATATDESASFGEGYVTVERGETASIKVSHSAAANLTIGGETDGFEVVVPLGGSGTDTVEFDTYRTTSSNPDDFLSVNGATLVSRPLEDAIEPGKYQLEVTIDGVTQAVGNLEVTPRGETVGTSGVLPADVDFEEASAGDVHGRVSLRENVAHGDYAAFVVNESGLGWAVEDDGSLADELTAEIVELDPETNTVADEFSGGDLRVVSQVEDHDRFLVLWDTDQVERHRSSNNTYEFRLTLEEHSNLVEEDERLVERRTRVVEPTMTLTAEPSFTLTPWDDATMRVDGQTNVAPTTTLDVRALQETPNSYLWKNVVDVSENGTFTANFDFSAATPPTSFPLWVREYRDLSEQTVELTTAEATVTFESQQVDNGTVAAQNVTVSHGGFVRLTANNTTIGATEYVSSGSYESVRVPLNDSLENATVVTATVVADRNRNGSLDASDTPYEFDGAPVADNATVLPDPDDSTDDQTTTAANRTETTSNLDVDESDPLTPDPDAGDGSGSSGGFVPLSPLTAVVALAAAALLAGRR